MLGLTRYYFFLVVSFFIFEVSAIFILLVSFLVVSTAVALAALSAFAVESAAEEPDLPLQAAAETAIAKAKKPILNEFFILVFLIK